MRVTFSAFSNTLASQLQRLSQRQAQLQNQVSTGLRITNLNDDPAAMGRVLNLQTEIQQTRQYELNNGHATEISQVSYSSVSALKTVSDRAGELVLLGGGVTSADSSKAYADEANQMLEQVVQTGNAQFNGQYIFGGTKTDQPPFTAVRDADGNISSVSYQGSDKAPGIRVGEDSTISPYTDGTTNQQFADFANHLVALRSALNSQAPAALQSVQSNLQTSEDHFLTAISNIGAVQTRLESNDSQNQARFSSLQSLTSKDTDVDLAPTVVKLSQTATAYQAAMQSGAKILQTSLLDYLK